MSSPIGKYRNRPNRPVRSTRRAAKKKSRKRTHFAASLNRDPMASSPDSAPTTARQARQKRPKARLQSGFDPSASPTAATAIAISQSPCSPQRPRRGKLFIHFSASRRPRCGIPHGRERALAATGAPAPWSSEQDRLASADPHPTRQRQYFIQTPHAGRRIRPNAPKSRRRAGQSGSRALRRAIGSHLNSHLHLEGNQPCSVP